MLPDTDFRVGAQAYEKAPFLGIGSQAADEVVGYGGQGAS
jgi:hypothetical protein